MSDQELEEIIKKEGTCKNFKDCSKEVWTKFRTSTRLFWIKTYCSGVKQQSCVRRAIKYHGQESPVKMLPNGSLIDD